MFSIGELEIVLFKHNDAFYRGRVVGVFSQGVWISFIDYGYDQIIDPECVYKWHPQWSLIPGNSVLKFQSIAFSFFNCFDFLSLISIGT